MTIEIPGTVRFGRDGHGLGRFTLTNSFAEAEVYLLGAQVTAFRPAGAEPVLWLSPRSAFVTGKAIRGGVPICWPWFGPLRSRPDLPAHGFARTREWNPKDAAQLSDGRTRLQLQIEDDHETRALWPHAFRLTLTITIGQALDLELMTSNTGDLPFAYSDALHTYLKVSDVRRTRVEGLDGAPFIHSTRHHRGVQSGLVTFAEEVNHIHVPHKGAVTAHDPAMKRAIEVLKSGSVATVVWNPGEAGGSAMPDVGAHWREFVCIEAANCADAQVTLLPGTSHITTQTVLLASAT